MCTNYEASIVLFAPFCDVECVMVKYLFYFLIFATHFFMMNILTFYSDI